MNTLYNIGASCALGLEKVLATELQKIGMEPQSKTSGRVFFKADKAHIAKALIWLRTADRIFIELAKFTAKNFDDLFEACTNIEWEKWIAPQDKLVIEKARCFNSLLAAQNAVQAITHKAAYTRLCKKYRVSKMPETGNTVMARVRIEDDVAQIELDICGQSLSKRGYRKKPGLAPIKETIAASLLFLAGWRRAKPLYDPFCGSGTIAIEAALYACNVAPGIMRSFAWELMPDGGKKEIAEFKALAKDAVNTNCDVFIAASDISDQAIIEAKYNASLAMPEFNIAEKINFFTAKAEEASPSLFDSGDSIITNGFIITDPPYGNRIGTESEMLVLNDSLRAFVKSFKSWQHCFVVNKATFSLFEGQIVKSSKIVDGQEIRYFHRFN